MRIMSLTSLLLPNLTLAFAPTSPRSEESKAWKVTGFIDAYHGWSGPRQGRGLTRAGRQFDPRNEEGRLAAAQLNITYTDPSGRFGATLSPWAGDSANLLFLTEPSDSKLAKHLAQAYLTFTDPKNGLSVDLGKFYSWIGFEGAESMGDDLYSRGLLYTLAQPVYHLGARVNKQIDAKWGASAYLTNGWNQVERDGGGLTGGFQIRYAPDAKTSAALGVISGPEGGYTANRVGSFGGIGYSSTGTSQTDLVDFIVSHQATDKLKLALNGDYASARGNGKSGNWSGFALIARYQHDSKLGFGARLELVRDDGGLRIGTNGTVNAFALGVDYWAHAQVLLRAEYRQDWSSVALFGSTTGPRKNQGTFTLAIGVKF